MKTITIGILGCGIVGTGVAKLLMEKKALLKTRTGIRFNLKYVADIDTETDRGITFEKGVFISDAAVALNDPEVDIIVETIGGKGVAKSFTIAALEQGKHVVTANKALLAEFGNELVATAKANNVTLAFEASTGGCMPVIKALRESLAGNRIDAMTGILNGTCNYILTKMSKETCSFNDALEMAQKKGFAEADPFLDIEGHDSAHKLAILNCLAYGMNINLADIHVEGITKITPMDIEFAREFGYTIKLLAISKNSSGSVEARVHPTMIRLSNPLAHVDKSMNAVTITGDATGQTMLYGHGAGMMPTASAVISDIVDIARSSMGEGGSGVPILGWASSSNNKAKVIPIIEINTRYYFRFEAADQPGVLSKISGILGDNGISIEMVHQKGQRSNGSVPVVMITHIAREANAQTALKKIASLDSILGEPVVIRIEDNENQ